jgi:hypothetical protein
MDKFFERIILIVIVILLVCLTWSIMQPTVIDRKNITTIAKAVNNHAKTITVLQQDIELFKKIQSSPSITK